MKSVRSIASMIAVIAVVVCCAKPAGAQGKAQIIEQWECFDRTQYREAGPLPAKLILPVLVKLTRLRTGNFEFGKVEASGRTQKAKFQIAGIDRRWDFGGVDINVYKYAFIITPNRQGLYYAFTGGKTTAKPREVFMCEKYVRGGNEEYVEPQSGDDG